MIKDLLYHIKNRNKEKTLELMKNLEISLDKENKLLIFNNKNIIEKQHEYYDKQQYIRKILLNSLYGSILNKGCRVYDERIGQSVTFSGRKIIYHMMSKINEILTNNYNHNGKTIIYGDTDSVTEDSEIYIKIKDHISKIKISELEKLFKNKISYNQKQYFLNFNEDIKTFSFNKKTRKIEEKKIEYLYSHETDKKIYKIVSEEGDEIKVTEDHSLIIKREGEILTIKPSEIKENDILIKLEI
ncbi:MAG: hypothetical protein NZZ41_00265 [Candidatus Dojkabacteria bacterium]|nr:hypothetical protein [Candidatus Dojkabacteria bacterium]